MCVAPSFSDVEWYINQRNSTSSLQQPWSRIQQQRWIERLYKQYGNDLPTLISKTGMPQGELEGYIRNLRLIDLIKTEEVKQALTEKEYKEATSHKFPITILERFFNNTLVKEKWGVETDGLEFKLKNKSGFLVAYAQLIKNIVSETPSIKIDTRTITTDLDEILKFLPSIDLEYDDKYSVGAEDIPASTNTQEEQNGESKGKSKKSTIKGDENRSKLILPIYVLNTTDGRLLGIFNELKELPISKYKNAAAASIRILLELSVNNWFETEGLTQSLRQQNQDKELRDIKLARKLAYIGTIFDEKRNKELSKLISRLCNKDNEYSLDVLNGYQHSKDSYYISKQFLNRFWDFLFPLFEVLLDIKEIQE